MTEHVLPALIGITIAVLAIIAIVIFTHGALYDPCITGHSVSCPSHLIP